MKLLDTLTSSFSDRFEYRYVVPVSEAPLTTAQVAEIALAWRTSDHHAALTRIASDPTQKDAFLRSLGWNENKLNLAILGASFKILWHFSMLGFMTDDRGVDDLRRLPFLKKVYEPPRDYDLAYVSILLGLHKALTWAFLAIEKEKTPITVLSLGPPRPTPFEADEPMNIATKILADHGVIVCVAAGNSGPANDTLNPWSIAPWVIGIGAAHSDGRRLWRKSSRGRPDDPLYRPTLVAPGVEVRTVRTGHVDEIVDPTGEFAIVTGTSFANGTIAGLVGLIAGWVRKLATTPQASEWREIAETQMNISVREIAPSPIVMKRLLTIMAMPMPDYEAHEVGAGFVDDVVVSKCLLEDFSLAYFLKAFQE